MLFQSLGHATLHGFVVVNKGPSILRGSGGLGDHSKRDGLDSVPFFKAPKLKHIKQDLPTFPTIARSCISGGEHALTWANSLT